MKPYIYHVIAICFALTMTGCSSRQQQIKQTIQLQQAEELMFNSPDSALRLLETMQQPSTWEDKANYALWCLLTTQAKVKELKTITSDSLIRTAYIYYKPTGYIRRKAMAALYMGEVYYGLGKTDEALKFYLEAKDEVEKTDDYQTGYLIMSALGKLYLYRGLASYAQEACIQAYDYAVKDDNKRYQAASLQFLARSYCISNQLPKAIETYRQCSEIVRKLGTAYQDYYYTILSEIALVYKNSGEFEKSQSLLKSFPEAFRPTSLIGHNYLHQEQYDSAYLYLNKALKKRNTAYQKASLYKALYKLANRPEYSRNLTLFCDSLIYYHDSIMELDKGKAIIAYKEKYDKEQLLSEKRQLELERTIWGMLSVIAVLLLILFSIYTYLRKKTAARRKEEELTALAIQLHQKELEANRYASYLAELQQQLENSNKKEEQYAEQLDLLNQLRKENELLETEKTALQQKIASYPATSHTQSSVKMLSDRLYHAEEREKELCTLLLAQIPLLNRLHSHPTYLNEQEMNALCRLTDDIFQNFTSRLMKDVPTLSEHEVILCSLIKLCFSISEIATFLNIVPTSVSRSKLRIKNKIYAELNENPKEKSLDIWLWEY